MTRLIDADALRQTIESNIYLGVYSYGAFLDALDEAPTVDAVPVVRCKDCKFIHDKGFCTRVAGLTRIKPDDFCSYGERRNDG